jgi:flagellar biosynthesis/type III secretory pathway chaperone
MNSNNPQELIDDLDEILNLERTALLEGDLEKLSDLVARKEDLIGALNAIGDLEKETLSQVQEKVTRNQALLTSAMEGIRAVSARMAELRRVRKGLDVYTQAGRKARYGTHGSSKLEKRA